MRAHIQLGKVALLERDPARCKALRALLAIAHTDAPQLLVGRNVEKDRQVIGVPQRRMAGVGALHNAQLCRRDRNGRSQREGMAVEGAVGKRLSRAQRPQHVGEEALAVNVAAGLRKARLRSLLGPQEEVIHRDHRAAGALRELARQCALARGAAAVDGKEEGRAPLLPPLDLGQDGAGNVRGLHPRSQPHFALDLAEAPDGEVEIVLCVARGDLRAHAVAPLGHDRVAEADDVHALFEHPARELVGDLGVVEHDGHDRVLAGQQVEAELLHLRAEIARIFMNLVAQRGGLGQHIDRLDRRGADGGGEGVGEEVRTAALAQQLDDLTPCGGVAAGGAAHGLAERAGQDVDPAHHAAVFRRAAAMLTHEADGVAVVDHDERVELVGQVADAPEVRNVAVHGKNAVRCNDDPLAARLARARELDAQVGHVAVFIAVAVRLAQPHAVDDARVVQLVGDDGVVRAEQRFKEAAVGVEAGGIEDGVLHADKIGDPALKRLVDLLCAADEAHGRKAEAPLVIALFRRGDQARVVGKTEIVVGAHIHNAACGGGVDAAFLGRCDDALILIGARLADGGKLCAVAFICGLHSALSSFFVVQSRITLPLMPLCMASKPFSKSV